MNKAIILICLTFGLMTVQVSSVERVMNYLGYVYTDGTYHDYHLFEMSFGASLTALANTARVNNISGWTNVFTATYVDFSTVTENWQVSQEITDADVFNAGTVRNTLYTGLYDLRKVYFPKYDMTSSQSWVVWDVKAGCVVASGEPYVFFRMKYFDHYADAELHYTAVGAVPKAKYDASVSPAVITTENDVTVTSNGVGAPVTATQSAKNLITGAADNCQT
eukprot:CAMPEP_0170515164 /NCGR_PEP_ID=MMETSP0209-20121228/1635_1 /TAXON_ID=665100 ORGANISM="Litonotus pictus, Strain P1" /NCGR_SAMPLE_ID=MMETSP0209 /ASSEMBLY_ACC=CAM_ASM_000301 /LENGTH=220 /DNA_ID=CAMNT_0010799527 /DNA_START=29 /DNA_END=691 /DNA_ORIENTATION=+